LPSVDVPVVADPPSLIASRPKKSPFYSDVYVCRYRLQPGFPFSRWDLAAAVQSLHIDSLICSARLADSKIILISLSRLKYLVTKGALVRKGQMIKASFSKFSQTIQGMLLILLSHFGLEKESKCEIDAVRGRPGFCGCSVYFRCRQGHEVHRRRCVRPLTLHS